MHHSEPPPLQSSATSLFRTLLSDDFDHLPVCVQRLHQQRGASTWRGEVEVERGRGLLSQCCAWATALPPAGRGAVAVDIVAEDNAEHWARHMGGRAMRSRLWAEEHLLCERLGAVEFAFTLRVENAAIIWRIARVRVFGWWPLPLRWFAGVEAREFAEQGRYCFDVRAILPLAGWLVHYRGWLSVDEP